MGRPPKLYSFPDVEKDLAPNLRKYILAEQKEALARHGVFRIGVSGGSLPKTLALALLTPEPPASLDKWEIFFVDERCVPLDHADSNYNALKTDFLSHLPADGPQPKLFPIDETTLADPQETADQYEQTLVSVFAARDSVKLPLFDLLLLGCGPDGHTASLFPAHALLRATDAWVLSITDSPKPPPGRITLSLPILTHACAVAFVATGAGKKDILKKIFEAGEEEGRALPSALVNEGGGDKVSWFCDAAAVEGLGFPKRTSVI